MALVEYSRDEGQVGSVILYHPNEDLAERGRRGDRSEGAVSSRSAQRAHSRLCAFRVRRVNDGLTDGTRRVPKKKKDDMRVGETDGVERKGDSRARGQDPRYRSTPMDRVRPSHIVRTPSPASQHSSSVPRTGGKRRGEVYPTRAVV